MRRATITLPDALDTALAEFQRDQAAKPSLTAVMQAALREFLLTRGYGVEQPGDPGDDADIEMLLAQQGYRPLWRPTRPFQIAPAPPGSGVTDLSINHDRYFADNVDDSQ